MAAKDGEILFEGEGELEALDGFISKRPASEGVDHDRRSNDECDE